MTNKEYIKKLIFLANDMFLSSLKWDENTHIYTVTTSDTEDRKTTIQVNEAGNEI